MTNEIFKSGTVMLVPFRFNANDIESINRARKQLIDIIPNSSSKNNSSNVFNSLHYPDFISFHLGNGFLNNGKDPYLKFYELDKNRIKALTSRLHFLDKEDENNKIYFQISKVQLILNQNKFLNEIALGYWMFEFEWEELDASILLDKLAKTDFFRFHYFAVDKNKQIKNKNQIIYNEKGDTFYLNCWLREFFSEFEFSQMNFYQPKPTLLHLINTQLGQKTENQFAFQAYCSLRVPPKNWLDGSIVPQNEMLNLKRISIATEIVSLDEGTLVLQKFINARTDVVNTYFPAFLMAVNQREVIHYLIQKTTTVFAENQSIDNDKLMDLRRLESLKSMLITAKHFQIFHTISKNSEINKFFKEMQTTFLIDEGIKDVQDSINEMNELFADEDRKQKEERENRMNLVLGLIAFLGIFSALTDIFELFDLAGKLTPHVVWIAIVLVLVFMFRPTKSK
ncbi:MAG: hypothetical protein RL264_1934 [Bacteroidota bacterium]|jgi:hypothetical protein